MADSTAGSTRASGEAANDRSPRAANGAGNRSVDELRSDIERMQSDLAVTVDAIADRVSPKNVAERAKSTAKDAVERAKSTAKAQVVDPQTGSVRKERVGAAGGVVLLLAGIRLTSELVRRRRRSTRRPRARR